MGIEQLQESIYEHSREGLLTGGRWLDMQNYRDPPPYPGHSKQVFTNQPGFRQSFSGSETSTDVSLSSTENLATSQRQEPQGEETQTSLYSHLDLGADGSSYSILARLGMPPGAIDSAGKFSSAGRGSASTTMSYMNPSSPYGPDRSQQLQMSTSVVGKSKLGPSMASPSPLGSQGHLTVPQWQVHHRAAGGGGGGYMHLQSSNEGGESGIGEFTSSSSSSSASRSAKEFSSSSSSSASTVTLLSGGSGGEYPSYVTSSARTGLVASSAGGLPGGAGVGGVVISSSLSSSSSSLSTHHQYLSPRVPPVSTYHHPHPYVNTHWTMGSGDSSSSQTPPLSYLGNLPPPPEYPGAVGGMPGDVTAADKSTDIRTCRSYEMMDKVNTQQCHPDLRLCASSPGIYVHDTKFSSPDRSTNTSADDNDQASIAAKASQMVEMLTEENRALREELAISSVKVARLQKLEMEIHKVHDSHTGLIKSSQKREALWQAMKRKLEERIQVLEGHGGPGKSHHSSSSSDSEFRAKLAEKDALISKLLSQNQELSLAKDQMEGENAQLNLSVAEQRAHVDIYENALLNAQSKVLTLEEERGKKQSYLDKVEQLQGALASLQAASEKQEKKSQEMRGRLEKELEMYKAQEKSGVSKRAETGRDDGKSVGMLRKMLDEKDARIMQLETEIAELEQKYVKEATLRQLNMDETPQAPKEVRLAALEKSSSDMGKLIDEAKTEKLKHMEELHQSQRKVAELEAKVKQLQTQVVEKEAMVKVFQRSPLALARSSSLHALCHSPLHSPRPSLIASHAWQGSSPSGDLGVAGGCREFATIRHMKTGSASAIELGRKMSMEEDLLTKVQNLNSESKSDSEDEVKLWHV
ncbi:angiomotin-like 2a isoform X2 [Aplysia californica]|uniref:Angiomotin-like 2a isoform X2 n=1 Tax=Aplysia californica TaxID=6500 RepID=A0ABM0K9D3_APLCA|nr:angiomotin-like 2a isoform X2 [Aplysia californica]